MAVDYFEFTALLSAHATKMAKPGSEKWRPMAISNPSTRLRMARSMPHWVMAQEHQNPRNQSSHRPPTPPKVPPPSLTGDCGDPDYEVIEFPLNRTPTNSIPQQTGGKNNKPLETKLTTSTTVILMGKCALCGIQNLFARCDACNESFCETCDDMNHKHPKRRAHVRRRIGGNVDCRTRPPLPPKGETQLIPPVPPPRRNRRNTQAKSTINQDSGSASLSNKGGALIRNNVNLQGRPLPSTPATNLLSSRSVQSLNTSTTAGTDSLASGMDKMSTLQERYRRYQEAMRAQDANRRRLPTADVSRDVPNQRPLSLGNPRNNLNAPPLPIRGMMQSASVCDLSTQHLWNPGIQQAQSVAQLGPRGMPMMWYPPGTPWDNSLGGSTMSLNHPAMWAYPMGYNSQGMIPPHYPPPANMFRCQSPARSYKSSRRSRAASPTPSLKSRKSIVSRSRRSPESTSDASSEESDDSEFDDRLSRSSRNLRRGSISRNRASSGGYKDMDDNRSTASKSRRGKWRSEDRNNGVNTSTRNINYDYDDLDSRSFSSRQPSENDDDRKSSRRAASVVHGDDSSSRSLSRRQLSSRQNSETDESHGRKRAGSINADSRSRFTSSSRHNSETDEDRKSRRPSESADDNERLMIKKNGTLRNRQRSSERDSVERKSNINVHRSKNTNSSDDGVESIHKCAGSVNSQRNSKDNKKLSSKETQQKLFNREISQKDDVNINKTLGLNESVSPQEKKLINKQKPPVTPVKNERVVVDEKETDNIIEEWACEHCTFVNEAKIRVCIVCCKTKRNALPPSPTNISDSPMNAVETVNPDIDKQTPILKTSNSEESGDSIAAQSKDGIHDNNHIESSVAMSPLLIESEKKEYSHISTSTSPIRDMEINSHDDELKSKSSNDILPDSVSSPTLNNQSQMSSNVSSSVPLITASTERGTSPPPQSIATQTYDELPPKTNGTIKKSKAHSEQRGMIYMDESDSEDPIGNTNSPDLYPRVHHHHQYVLQPTSSHGTRRNSIDSTHLYYHSREASQSRHYPDTGIIGPPSPSISTLTRQGLEIVELLREAERLGFSADDIQVALVQAATNPIDWLINQWPHLIETVQTLVSMRGKEMSERDNDVGILSAAEAKDVLRLCKGDVWTSVTKAIQLRQQKVARIMLKGNFPIVDVVRALDNNAGNEDVALLELQKNQLKPFLMRIWGPPAGVENDEVAPREDAAGVSGMSGIHEQSQGTLDLDAKKQVILSSLDNFAELQADHHEEFKTSMQTNDYDHLAVNLSVVTDNNPNDLSNSSEFVEDKNNLSKNLKTMEIENNLIEDNSKNSDNNFHSSADNIFKDSVTEYKTPVILQTQTDNSIHQEQIEINPTENVTVEQLLSAMKSLPEQFLGPLTVALQGLSAKSPDVPDVPKEEEKSSETINSLSEISTLQFIENNSNEKLDENKNDLTIISIEESGKKETVTVDVAPIATNKIEDDAIKSDISVRTNSEFENKSDIIVTQEKKAETTPIIQSIPSSRMNAFKSFKSRLSSMISRLPLSKTGIMTKIIDDSPDKIDENIHANQSTFDGNKESLNTTSLLHYSSSIAYSNSSDIHDASKNINNIKETEHKQFVSESVGNNLELFQSSAIIIPTITQASPIVINNPDNHKVVNKIVSIDDQTIIPDVSSSAERTLPVCLQELSSIETSTKVKRSTIYIEPLSITTDKIMTKKLEIDAIEIDAGNVIENSTGGDVDELNKSKPQIMNQEELILEEQNINILSNEKLVQDFDKTIESNELPLSASSSSSLPEIFELKIIESPLIAVNDAAPVEESPVVTGSLKINLSCITDSKEITAESIKFASQQLIEGEIFEPIKPLIIESPNKIIPVDSTNESFKKSPLLQLHAKKNNSNSVHRLICIKPRPKSPVKRAYMLRKLPTKKNFNCQKKITTVGRIPKNSALSRAKEFADRVSEKMSTQKITTASTLKKPVHVHNEDEKLKGSVNGVKEVKQINKDIKENNQKSLIKKNELRNEIISPKTQIPSRIPVFRKKPLVAGKTVSVINEKILKINILQPNKSNINPIPRRIIPVLQPLIAPTVENNDKINNVNVELSFDEDLSTEQKKISIDENSTRQDNEEKNAKQLFRTKSNDSIVENISIKLENSPELISSSGDSNEGIEGSDDELIEDDVNEEEEEEDSNEEKFEEEITESSFSETSDSNTKSSVIFKKLNSTEDLTSAELMLKKTLDDIKAEISNSEYEEEEDDDSEEEPREKEEEEEEFSDNSNSQQSENINSNEISMSDNISIVSPIVLNTDNNKINESDLMEIKVDEKKVLKIQISEPEIVSKKESVPRKRFSIVASYVQQFEGDSPTYERKNSKQINRQHSPKRERDNSPKDEREVSRI
ncbi:hypothetical protein PV326_006271 [Microctonus aethiopoides]|nr:hypothetical protein PV326_006271 [Microctonus aethiopoides]